MNYCGIDLASKSSAICIAEKEGEEFCEFDLPTDEKSFTKAFGEMLPARCLLEASPLAEWAAGIIEGCGHEVVIVDPRKGLVQTAIATKSRILGLLRAHGIKLGAVSEGEFVDRVRALVQSRCKALLKRLAKAAVGDELCSRLMTVPGVGPLTAIAFVATIDDPSRFEDGEQVASYIGLVPSVFQTGETEHRGPITKEGDGLLRWLLVEAAHVLLTRTKGWCRLKAWGVGLIDKRGYGKARVAVARKLAMLLHHLWVTGNAFEWSQP